MKVSVSNYDKGLNKKSIEIHPGKINNLELVYDVKEFLNSNGAGTIEYVIKKEKKDYLKLVSKKIWDFLYSIYKGGPEIKRVSFIQKDENNEVRTLFDLYYNYYYLYFAIKYDDEVDVNTIITKEPYKIFIPNYKTILEFKELIMNCFLSIYEINQKLVKIYKRLWKVNIINKENLNELKRNIAEKKERIENIT